MIEGQRPLLADSRTLGRLFRDAGHVTAAIGTWGPGGLAPPVAADGVSFLPILVGERAGKRRAPWLCVEFQDTQAVRVGIGKG